MARPKAYDEDTVLTAAMLCFWRNGYTATSIKDLQVATALTPGSLYNSFESKNGLFTRALDYYVDKVVQERVARLLLAEDPIKGIEQYFIECFDDKAAARGMGCLLVNTSTELGSVDEMIRKKVAAGRKVAEQGLASALVRAQRTGQLSKDIDVIERATHLALLLSGMLVSTKTVNNRRWLPNAMGIVRGLLR
jgi:TetR/AcrR family transcriptional repressor of nem operon